MERILNLPVDVASINKQRKLKAADRVLCDHVSQSFMEEAAQSGTPSKEYLIDIGWHGLQLAKEKMRLAYPSKELMAEARKMKKEY